jgi:GntR family transcriptional regulator
VPAIFSIDPRSGVPIYLQLIEQIKRAVALGTLEASEQLPTVKALALELTVNPNTVARAYRDLERDGVIETSPGRGSFVRADDGGEKTRRAADDIAADLIAEAVRQARALGLNRPAVSALVERALKRWYGPGDNA